MRTREEQLVDVARWTRRYLKCETYGLHDAVLIGRELERVLDLFDDIEPMHDADRAEWQLKHAVVRA